MTGRSAPGRWIPPLVLLTTTLAALLVFGTASALNVALPALSADLEVPAATADWFLLAFLLTNTAFILVFGRLSDAWGRRGLYLSGLALFTLAGLGCLLAPNEWWLIGLRALQGIAAACAVSNSTAVLTDVFSERRLALALSLNITGGAVATLLGPVAGGYLVEHYGWRSLFAAGLPIGVVAIIMGSAGLRSLHRPVRTGERYDFAGAVFSVLGLGSLLFGVNRASDWGISDARVWGTLAAAVLFIAAFALVEARTTSPLLDVSLLRGARGYAYLACFFTAVSFGAVPLLVMLYRQLIDGASPAEAGLAIIPMGLAMLTGSLAGGALGRWLPPGLLIGSGTVLLTAGSAVLTLVFLGGAPAGGWALTVALVLCGLGDGIFMATITHSVMVGVAANRRAIANGFRSVLHNGALALSAAVVLLVIAAFSGASYSSAAIIAADARQGFVVAALILTACGLLGCTAAWLRGRSAARPALIPRQLETAHVLAGRFSPAAD